MKPLRTILFVVIISFLYEAVPAADCPEIDTSLQHTLNRLFPDFILADNQGDQPDQNTCPHITSIGSGGFVLVLKKKTGNAYLLVQTDQLVGKSKQVSVHVIDTIDGAFPIIKEARGGFYSDSITGKNFTVARDSTAVSVILTESGQQYIYKKNSKDKFIPYRIQ